MIQLLSHSDINEQLKTAQGREALHSYALTPQGHSHLTQYCEATQNTFVRALLADVLIKAALAHVEAGGDLALANELDPQDVPLEVTPRPATLSYSKEFFYSTIEAHLTRKLGADYAAAYLRNVKYTEDVYWPLRGVRNSLSAPIKRQYDAFNRNLSSEPDRTAFQRGFSEFLESLFAARMLSDEFFYQVEKGVWDWNTFIGYSGASAGTLTRIALKMGVSEEMWTIIEARSKDDLRDLLLIAAAHPSLPEREAACIGIASQVPYFLNEANVYDLGEVLALLPKATVAEILPSIASTLHSAWTEDAYRAWTNHVFEWGGISVELPKTKVEAATSETKRTWFRR